MMKPFKKLVGATMIAGLALSTTTSTTYASDDTIVFGVVPQQSATRLAQIWVPLMQHLSAETGQNFKFATAKDIPTFEACLAQNAYDVAYMNPYHYTVFHEASGYQAFARVKDKRLKGVIVARADSNVQALEDLDGKDVAFPSPAAFGASVIPRAEMGNRNIDVSPAYVKSHDSVYRSVALGLYPAGGGVKRTLNNVPETLRAQLKVIYQTNGYTPHAFAADKSLPPGTREMIAKKLIALTDGDLLKPLGMAKGFEAAHNHDWDDVRGLNLSSDHTQIVAAGDQQCLLG